jgi:hypothetical protein
MVSLDVFRSIPRMSCGDVDNMLGKLQNNSLNQLVSQLRDIAGENSHFADNWVTADIPSVIISVQNPRLCLLGVNKVLPFQQISVT